MCRSIVRLREGTQVAPTEDIEAAARQFVRKVSGFTKPAEHNREVFERAVSEITDSVQRLMAGLEVRGAR
ncbi:MAG TPA: DUF2277 domain-containing protein [Acidimicrobiia bacterium]|jgi:hypothetical protein|nr:DUF2277 domain-containing protein [Acidimicrobiia bacterium]